MARVDLFPLDIFPIGSLASSVITTVWVGVLVVTFFNLRFGWVLSGLVVPGYLVPLLIVKPWSAAVVIGEGLVTYLLVRLLSERFSRWGWWSPFFGRDRFFALVLFSILTRIVFDLLILPELGELLTRLYGTQFDYRYNLHSFGLIIVALIANQFWKPGLRRGLVPFAVILAVTFVLVRYGLMEWTNFSISSLGYLYEDVAFSILASPKSYIILITAAYIASRMNLHYGWEFNGILIPSLIALQWYQPFKILTTFVETGLILLLAMAVLRLPLFRRASIEGARKLRFFFNLSFIYKMILGYLILWLAPAVKVTDVYGFGYLLPTLMAIKMHDKGIALRLTRATLQTSLTAVAGASLFGFALTLMPSPWAVKPVVDMASVPPITTVAGERLADVIRREKMALYQGRARPVAEPLARESESFGAAVERLSRYAAAPDPELLDEARSLLAEANYRIYRVEDRYLVLREGAPRRGWGTYVFNLKASNALLVAAPDPLAEGGLLEGATGLFAALNARCLAMPGSVPLAGARGEFQEGGSLGMFHTFHRRAGQDNLLQVRGYTPALVRALGGGRKTAADVELPTPESSLWIKSQLPPGLNLKRLEELIGQYPLRWETPPLENPRRDQARTGFAELFLNREGLRRLNFSTLLSDRRLLVKEGHQRIDGYLQSWLLSGKEKIAPQGSDLYQVPLPEELLYFDMEVLTPLLGLANAEYRDGDWTEAADGALRQIAAAAGGLGYLLLQYHHLGTGADYLILAEDEAAVVPRYWGTYVLRLGSARGFVVQVPRPLAEINSFEYAVALFEELQGRALLIGGAYPSANLDGSADLVRARNKGSLFSLVNQVLLRESGPEPLLVVQSRAFGYRPEQPPIDADILLAFGAGEEDPRLLKPLGGGLWERLERDGLQLRLVDGAPETAGYEVGSNAQFQQLQTTENKDFVLLWLAPLARAGYRQQSENRLQAAQFDALGIPSREADLSRELRQRPPSTPPLPAPAGLTAVVAHYQRSQDIVALQNLLRRWPHLRWERIIDLNSRQAFLWVGDDADRPLLVANLAPRDGARRFQWPETGDPRETIDAFIDTRSGWLEFGGLP